MNMEQTPKSWREKQTEPISGATFEASPKQTVAEKFEKEFQIKKEELGTIEGFDKLSDGQQLLALENLKQLTLGRIQEETDEKYKSEHNPSEMKFFGKIWEGVSKTYQIAKLEKKTAKEIMHGGIETHKKTLKQLTKGLNNFGPEVKIIDGKLEIQYASGFKNLSESEQKEVDNFNKIATDFSKIPYEWSLDTADKFNKNKYNEIKERYEESQRKIFNLKMEEPKENPLVWMFETEAKIKMNQFLNEHPEVEEKLQDIENQTALMSAIKSTVTERGFYAALGFAGRSISAGILGWIAAPAVASVLGGFRERGRAKKMLKEKDIIARRGTKTKDQLAKNFVSAQNLIKLKNEKGNSTEKVKDSGLVAKLDQLIKKVESDPNEKNLTSLEARIEYTETKIREGLVDFGKSDQRLTNQYELMTALTKALALKETNFHTLKSPDPDPEKNLGFRLNRILNIRHQKISSAREKHLRNQFIKGATLGFGFGLAGAGVRNFMEYLGWLQTPGSSAREPFEYPPPGTEAENKIIETPYDQDPANKKYWPKTPDYWKDLTPEEPKIPHELTDAQKAYEAGEFEASHKLPPELTEAQKAYEAGEVEASYKLSDTPKPEIKSIPVEFKKGDSVWKIVRDQLPKIYGEEKYNTLTPDQKTYLIDAIKNKIVANPEKFQLPSDTEFTKIKIGQKMDLGPAFSDNEEMDKIFGKAQTITHLEPPAPTQITETALPETEPEPYTIGEKQTILPEEKQQDIRYQDKKDIEPTSTIKGEEMLLDEEEKPLTEGQILEQALKEQAEIETNAQAYCEQKIGFTEKEYKAIADTSLGKLFVELKQALKIPDDKLNQYWVENGSKINLPHEGKYDINQFKKHLQLAKAIQNRMPNKILDEVEGPVKIYIKFLITNQG